MSMDTWCQFDECDILRPYLVFLVYTTQSVRMTLLTPRRKFGIGMEHFLRVGKLSPHLLSAVRVCVMSKSELASFDTKSAKLDFISKRNEAQMIETLTGLLEGMLEGYGTSIEQDDAILSTVQIPRNKRLSTLYRREQKMIIDHALGQLLHLHSTING